MARPRKNTELEIAGTVGTAEIQDPVTDLSGNSGSGDFISDCRPLFPD